MDRVIVRPLICFSDSSTVRTLSFGKVSFLRTATFLYPCRNDVPVSRSRAGESSTLWLLVALDWRLSSTLKRIWSMSKRMFVRFSTLKSMKK